MDNETITEIWKPVLGYNNTYWVSSFGRVKSLKKNKERMLKAGIASNGYYTVALCKDGEQQTYTVHSLVANYFVDGKSPLKNFINHIDGNKLNNNVSNLEWCTNKENLNHAALVLKHFGGIPKVKVKCLETNIIYESVQDAARKLGLSHGNISSVLYGNRKTTGGYHWSRA